MQKDVPLVVPEVNSEALEKHNNIIANPNCSTMQMVLALKPLHDEYKINRVVVSTYQAVSGAGKAPTDELFEQTKNFLDKNFPLNDDSWKNISQISIKNINLKNQNQLVGYKGTKDNPNSILLKNNNLHVDVIIDTKSKIGSSDKAGISDVVIESAISTIVDNEDSVAAVDAEDKVKCYRNWLGIMKGNLQTEMQKNGKKFTVTVKNASVTEKNGPCRIKMMTPC